MSRWQAPAYARVPPLQEAVVTEDTKMIKSVSATPAPAAVVVHPEHVPSVRHEEHVWISSSIEAGIGLAVPSPCTPHVAVPNDLQTVLPT